MIKILIIEDQAMFRDSLSFTLNGQTDMKVVGVTDDASMSLKMCRELKPDLVLMDVVTKNNTNGISYAALIRKELPDIKVVIMTGWPEITFVEEARKAGAHSYIYKNFESHHLFYLIRYTMDGMSIFMAPTDPPHYANQFTERELAVIRLTCLGKSRSQMLEEMGISEMTLKPLITSILNKTGFDTIMEFAVYAAGKDLIAPIQHGDITTQV
jgi:DNA-binding NarL/FixJ family response regulator